MPALNQPIFRSNAIKHYMQGREKHEFPRFISLPTTILLWMLLALFVAATALVWSEQVPTYVATQGIVVVQSATQSSERPVPATGKSVSMTGKQVSATGKSVSMTGKQVSATEKSVPMTGKQGYPTGKSVPMTGKQVSAADRQVPTKEKLVPATVKLVQPPTVMAIFFFSPAQAQNLHLRMPVNLNISASGLQIKSQITRIEPNVMSPAALRALFHLENTSLSITQPSIVVMVKLDPALATKYADSLVSTNLQVGSQRLISFLPGVGGLFGK